MLHVGLYESLDNAITCKKVLSCSVFTPPMVWSVSGMHVGIKFLRGPHTALSYTNAFPLFFYLIDFVAHTIGFNATCEDYDSKQQAPQVHI